jgi:hypothetical protein
MSPSSSRRQYATALGFYLNDRVWVDEIDEGGYITKVAGPESHAITVRLDSGLMAPLEDFDLTRTR